MVSHKSIGIYSDGCLCINNLTLNTSKSKTFLTVHKKDYKFLQKLSKNSSLEKKTNNYRNKIF